MPARQPVRTNAAKVLVVEDMFAIRQIITTILEMDGYETDCAVSGNLALDMLKENRYDLVLMDCSIRDMDGFQLTTRIRDPQSGVHNNMVPIVAVTGHTQKEFRQKCLDAGMNDFLGKPFLIKELLVVVRRWTGTPLIV